MTIQKMKFNEWLKQQHKMNICEFVELSKRTQDRIHAEFLSSQEGAVEESMDQLQ